jgi:hypothetical protein
MLVPGEIIWMSVAMVFYLTTTIFLVLWIKEKPASSRKSDGGNSNNVHTSDGPDAASHIASLGPMGIPTAGTFKQRRQATPAAHPANSAHGGPGLDSMNDVSLTMPPPRSGHLDPTPGAEDAGPASTVMHSGGGASDIQRLAGMSSRELASVLSEDPGLSYSNAPPLPTGPPLGAFPQSRFP